MTKELVDEALRWANGHPNRRSSELMRELADALEVRQPGENDREALDKIVTEYDMALYTKEETLDRLSLAVVPDAATEELEKIKPLFENLSREYPIECNKRVRAEAERDAAHATIERVRAEHPVGSTVLNNSICQTCGMPFPCPTIAALDGAPEPEWEWGVQYIPPSAYAGEPVKCASERAARLAVSGSNEPIRLHRRRPKVVHPAGPWEPVGGEN